MKDEVTGLLVRSEGLLQLTYEDSKRYGCDFDWAADKALPSKDPSKTILQPKNNLECGVKILANQIIVQHKSLLSPASGYWSTLQSGRPSYRVFVKQMTNPPIACGLHVKHARMVQSTQAARERVSPAEGDIACRAIHSRTSLPQHCDRYCNRSAVIRC